ncbi:MAG: SH3 domain-containing protein [Bryobacteraceae bacterium]
MTGCGTQSEDELGHAYVAPATLNLRRELIQKNNNVAVLKYGERVSVIDVRRRFVKVRSQNGAEGWVDSLQLLSPEQMDQIRKDNQEELALPSEGAATVFEALNIHLDPSRQSPAFTKIEEGASVAVLAHRVEPKTSGPPRPPAFGFDRREPLSRRQRRERQSKNKSNLPPPPPPPKPPENWQELSAERIDGSESTAEIKANKERDAAEQKKQELARPVVLEDWTLVRTKYNQCGWVLSRNLLMSIPDEVAQYAEGKRISSYFDLGAVQDEQKGLKHHWLWTISSRVEPYDFDAWRVFLWNRRRHRYETSYRQHDLEGYFPVHVDGPAFEVITQDDDGKFRRRAYLFDGVRVHLTRTEDYQPGASKKAGKPAGKPGGLDTNSLEAKMPKSGWLARQWTALKRRISGRD